jgi:hypothetical protein
MAPMVIEIDQDFQSMGSIAFGIQKTAEGTHIGLFFRESHGELKFLHFAWHCTLRLEIPSDKYVGFKVSLPEERAEIMAEFCEMIWEQHHSGTIPYGLRKPTSAFNLEDGSIQLGDEACGLTCATFVLAIFDAMGFPLLAYEEWRSRPGDMEFQNHILALLSQHKASQTHIDKVRKEVGCVRFRPEDIVAASFFKWTSWPISFPSAHLLGEWVLTTLGVHQKLRNQGITLPP